MINQRGYITWALIAFAFLIGIMMFPIKFPTQTVSTSSGTEFCRPDPPGQEVTIEATAMDEAWGEKIVGTLATYTRVKSRVPIDERAINDEHSLEGDVVTTPQGKFRIYYAAPINGKTIGKWQGRVGESEQFYWVNGYMDRGISLARHGIIFALHIDEADKPIKLDLEGKQFYVMDIYKDQNRPALPDEVYQCLDVQTDPGGAPEFPAEPPPPLTVTTNSVIFPGQDIARPNNQLQLEWFLFGNNKFLHHAWWYPVCKPAVYLYPPVKTLVNVKVFPDGYLTYVDPPYDKDTGWTVWAEPDGSLFEAVSSAPFAVSRYDYLYYESKIHDSSVKKPTQGWVVKFDELEGLYEEILPKLGLNEKQSFDFIEYWEKALPDAPYYFVGVVSQENVDQIERLEILPKPDSINRVRIYFERLDAFREVEAPVLSAVSSQTSAEDRKLKAESEFRVVEWGGMVKNDLNHPFTCSQ